MTKNSLLITRPNYDYTTRYISAWAQGVVDEAVARGLVVSDLKANRASRAVFESVLQKMVPRFIFINGHGDDALITGQDGEILVRAGENEAILKNLIVYALSCRSARILGPASVQGGARAYIGYREDFIFMYSAENRTRPINDSLAGLFLEPSNRVALALLKGHSVHDACMSGKRAFVRNIQKLLSSQTSTDDSSALRYLLWDMQHMVYHGDATASLV